MVLIFPFIPWKFLHWVEIPFPVLTKSPTRQQETVVRIATFLLFYEAKLLSRKGPTVWRIRHGQAKFTVYVAKVAYDMMKMRGERF